MTIVQKPGDDGSTAFVDSMTGRELLFLNPRRGAGFNRRKFVRLEDDFLGDVIADQWNGTAAATGTAPAITITGNGVVRLTTATTNDNSVLAAELNWIPANGEIYMEAFVKLASVTNIAVNIGFTDTKANEVPITISGTTITTNATDAAVFVFDTAQTNDFWHCQGVATDVDTAILNTGLAPVGATFYKFGVRIDTAGNAYFYIDDALVGTVGAAVTPSVALTPVIAQIDRTTTAKNVDVDYIIVTAVRA